jgi:phage/plasmid-like protein (TIGR03299 family)
MRSTENVSYTNISEAITAFNLDFTVEKAPIFTNIDNELEAYGDKVITYRTDNKQTLGVVGNGYEIVQNMAQFEVFQKFADEGLISFEQGGVFGGGRRTYIQAVLPSTIDINNGDITKKYITICSSHDGTIALQAFVSPVRIWCGNTFNLAIKTGQHKQKIKHTVSAPARLIEAINTIENALETYHEYDEFLLTSTRTKEYNDKEVEKFIEMILPNDGKLSTRKTNQRIELLESIYGGIGQDSIDKNNLYKLWNGVTTWTNNVLGAKKEDAFEFVTYASGANINSHAYDISTKILHGELVLS